MHNAIRPMTDYTLRFDVHYEAAFRRPIFSRMTSFLQIIEPIYDSFSAESKIPLDAISVENGNTIAAAGVTLKLFSGRSMFEVRLDGYRVHFYDLTSSERTGQAIRHARLFEEAIYGFLSDPLIGHSKLVMPSWIKLEAGDAAANSLMRKLAWHPSSSDPFEIGATSTLSLVKFECTHQEDYCRTGIAVDKSALPEADLFLEISREYTLDSLYRSFEDKLTQLASVRRTILNKLSIAEEDTEKWI